MKKKKILMYINTISNGGAERVLVNLAGQLVQDNEIIFVTSFPCKWEYKLDDRVTRINLEDSEITCSRLNRNFTRIKKLRKIIKNRKPDICLSFMGEPNFRLILATRGLETKTIISVRNDPNREYGGRLMGVVGKCILPMADGCVFQTREAMEWFPKKLQKKSCIIYNPVKSSFYEVNRKTEKHLIVACGRIAAQKNYFMLVDAFGLVLQSIPSAILEVYGEGPLKEELQRYIHEKAVAESIKLMGQSDCVEEVLSRADVFVMSSDYEGMPNALMEAMAAGVPAVSTDCPCGGPRELFGDALEKNLVPVKDAEKLAERLIELSQNDKEKKEVSIFEKRKAVLWSEEKITEMWIEFFDIHGLKS